MGLSRNKVAVPEGAAGSPPFYGEFSPMFFGQCVPHDGVTVMPYSVDAGVEEIIGLDGIRPVREWYGYAFGLPDRHPTGLFLWRGSMPTWSRPVPFGAGWKRVARGGLRTG
ncbi:hypothetical protein BIFADO_02424 [Bifidobacterium adolescentis L2-32]|uniref:Uncharacterized protein n=1 Tax=Bifidobacterium adolescentis L2-32 TaxID=411481 RepID=A7A978_BIFAD|nr:hypothetical protein BIFADO_02424 [Bifidobacterium adolescentis L2-32]